MPLLEMMVMATLHPLLAVFAVTLDLLPMVLDASPMLTTMAIVLHAVLMDVAMAMVPRAVVLVAMAMALHMPLALTVNGMKQPPLLCQATITTHTFPQNPLWLPTLLMG